MVFGSIMWFADTWHELWAIWVLMSASIGMSQTVLIAPLDCSTCPNQGRFFSLRITLRWLISSRANRSFDLTLARFSGFTSQICLIMALSLCQNWSCQGPSLTCMKHHIPDTWAVHTTTGLVGETMGGKNRHQLLELFLHASSHPPATESMSPK